MEHMRKITSLHPLCEQGISQEGRMTTGQERL